MKRSFLSVGVSVIYLIGNVALGYSAETNLWAQRRSHLARSSSPVALLPAEPARISAVLDAAGPAQRFLDASVASRIMAPGSSSRLARALAHFPAQAAAIRRIVPAKRGVPSQGAVVLIQDVHLNLEAQENIAKVLLALEQSATPGQCVCVGVEGAFGKFNFDRFAGLPDADIAKRVARYFLTAGRIAAPTYVGIAGHGPDFRGVDDPSLYAGNRAAVEAAQKLRPSAAKTVVDGSRALADQKRAVLNPDLKRFDDLRSAHRDGSLSLGVYLERLAALTPGGLPDAVGTFLEAFKIERTLDFAQVERDRRRMVEKIAASASPAELQGLVDESLRYRAGEIGYAQFHESLSALAVRKGVDLSKLSAFNSFLRYLVLADGIRADALFDGIRTLEDTAVGRLAHTDEERVLLRRDEAAFLAQRLVAFSLTPEEWRSYGALRALSPLAPDVSSAFEMFYEKADARSERIVQNLLAAPASDGVRGLLVGGFHTEAIAARLAESGVDVAILQPALTKIDGVSGTEYLSIFAREKAPLERVLTGEKLFLAPSELEVGDPSNRSARVTEDIMIHTGLATAALGGRAGRFPAGASRLENEGGSRIVTTQSTGRTLRSTPDPVPAGYRELADGMPAPGADSGLPALTFIQATPSAPATLMIPALWIPLIAGLAFPFIRIFGRGEGNAGSRAWAFGRRAMDNAVMRRVVAPLVELALMPGIPVAMAGMGYVFSAVFLVPLVFALFHGLPDFFREKGAPASVLFQSPRVFLGRYAASVSISLLSVSLILLAMIAVNSGFTLPFADISITAAKSLAALGFPAIVSDPTFLAPALGGILMGGLRHSFFNAGGPVGITESPRAPPAAAVAIRRAMALGERRWFGLLPPRSPTAAPFLRLMRRYGIEVKFDDLDGDNSVAITDYDLRGKAMPRIRINQALLDLPPEAILPLIVHEAFHAFTHMQAGPEGGNFVQFEMAAQLLGARVWSEVGTPGLDAYFLFVGAMRRGGYGNNPTIYLNMKLENGRRRYDSMNGLARFFSAQRRDMLMGYLLQLADYKDLGDVNSLSGDKLTPEERLSVGKIVDWAERADKMGSAARFQWIMPLALLSALSIIGVSQGTIGIGAVLFAGMLFGGLQLLAMLLFGLDALLMETLLPKEAGNPDAGRMSREELVFGPGRFEPVLRWEASYRRFIQPIFTALVIAQLAAGIFPDANGMMLVAAVWAGVAFLTSTAGRVLTMLNPLPKLPAGFNLEPFDTIALRESAAEDQSGEHATRPEGDTASASTEIRRVTGAMRHWVNNAFTGSLTYIDLLAPGDGAIAANREMLGYMDQSARDVFTALDAFDASANHAAVFFLVPYDTGEIWVAPDTPGYGPDDRAGRPTMTGEALDTAAALDALRPGIRQVRAQAERLFAGARAGNGALTPSQIADLRRQSLDLRQAFDRLVRDHAIRADYLEARAAGLAATPETANDRKRFLALVNHELGNRLGNVTGILTFGTADDGAAQISARAGTALERLDKFDAWLEHIRPENNDTPFYAMGDAQTELFATADTAVYGGRITPAMVPIPGDDMVRRTDPAAFYAAMRMMSDALRGYLGRYQSLERLSPADISEAQRTANNTIDAFRRATGDYGQFTSLMAAEVRAAQGEQRQAPQITVEMDLKKVQAAPVPEHRQRLLILFAREMDSVDGALRRALGAVERGDAAGYDAIVAAAGAAQAFLESINPDRGESGTDLFLVQDGGNAYYAQRTSPGMGDAIPANAPPLKNWRFDAFAEIQQLSESIETALNALNVAVAAARAAGDPAAVRSAVSHFEQASNQSLLNYRRKNEVLRAIWSAAVPFQNIPFGRSSVTEHSARFEQFERHMNRIADAALLGVGPSHPERRDLVAALNMFGYEFDEDTTPGDVMASTARLIVERLSVDPATNEETLLLDQTIRELDDGNLHEDTLRNTVKTFGWRLLPILAAVVKEFPNARTADRTKLLTAVVESRVAIPADRDLAVRSAAAIFESFNSSLYNFHHDMGEALGSLGAPAIRFLIENANRHPGVAWRILVATGISRALAQIIFASGAQGDAISRLEQAGISPEQMRMITDIQRVELHNDGRALGTAPLLFEGLLGNVTPEGSDVKAPGFESALTDPFPPVADVALTELLTRSGVAMNADGSVPAPALVLGRTIYFRRTDGRYLGLKFLRDNGEKPAELLHESRVQSYLAGHGDWNLQSRTPEPVILDAATDQRVGRVTGIPESLQATLSGLAVSVAADHSFIAYIADPDYTVYVQNVADDGQFSEAVDRSLNDLAIEARKGIVHTTVFDATHTSGRDRGREDRGVFLWNVDVLAIRQVGVGTGRLHSPADVLRYTNLRKSGTADQGDMRGYRVKAGRFSAAANFTFYLGSYLLAASLLEGMQLENGGKLRDWNDPVEVQRIADWHLDRFSSFAATYMRTDRARVRSYLAGAVDWKTLARQMIFFMGKDADGRFHYYKYLVGEQPWPKEIYPTAEIELPAGNIPPVVNDDHSSEWRLVVPEVGWADVTAGAAGGRDVHPHRGPVNGPFDVQELIRAIYVTTTLMMTQSEINRGTSHESVVEPVSLVQRVQRSGEKSGAENHLALMLRPVYWLGLATVYGGAVYGVAIVSLSFANPAVGLFAAILAIVTLTLGSKTVDAFITVVLAPIFEIPLTLLDALFSVLPVPDSWKDFFLNLHGRSQTAEARAQRREGIAQIRVATAAGLVMGGIVALVVMLGFGIGYGDPFVFFRIVLASVMAAQAGTHMAYNAGALATGRATLTVDSSANTWPPVPPLLMRQIRYGYLRTSFALRAASTDPAVRAKAAAELGGIIVAMRQIDPSLSVFSRDWLGLWTSLLNDANPDVHRRAAEAISDLVGTAKASPLPASTLAQFSNFFVDALRSTDRTVRDIAMAQLSDWKAVLSQADEAVHVNFVQSYAAGLRAREPRGREGAAPGWLQFLQKAVLFFTLSRDLKLSAFTPSTWRATDHSPEARRALMRALFRADPTGARFEAALAPLYRDALRSTDERLAKRAANELDDLGAFLFSVDPTGRLAAAHLEPLIALALEQTDAEVVGAAMYSVQRLLPLALQADPAMHERWLGLNRDATEKSFAAAEAADQQELGYHPPTARSRALSTVPQFGTGAGLVTLGPITASETAEPLASQVAQIRAHLGAENFEEAAAPLGIQVIVSAYEQAARAESSGRVEAKEWAMALRGQGWSEVIELLRGIRARPRAAGPMTTEFIETLVRMLALGGDIEPAVIKLMYNHYFNKPFEWDVTKLSADDLVRSSVRAAPKGFTGPKDLLGHILLDFGINRLNPNPDVPMNTFQIYLRTSKDSPAYAELKLYLAAMIADPFLIRALSRFDAQGKAVPPSERDQYWGAVRHLFKALLRDAEAYHAAGMERNLAELTSTPMATVESLTTDMRRMVAELRANLPDGPRRQALDAILPDNGARATAADVDKFLRDLDQAGLVKPAVSTIFSITKGMLEQEPDGPLAAQLRTIQETAKFLSSLPPLRVRAAVERLRTALAEIRDRLPETRTKAPTGGRRVEGWRETTDKAVAQLDAVQARLVAERPASRVEFENLEDKLARFEALARENNFPVSPMTLALAELRAAGTPDDVLFEGVAERISDFFYKEVQLYVAPDSTVRNPDLSPPFVELAMELIVSLQSVQRRIKEEHAAAALIQSLGERVKEIGFLGNPATANKFIQFRVDRWAVGISGKVAEVFALDVEHPADVILGLKENQALTYVVRHAQFRMFEHPLRQTLAAYFEALLRGKTRAEAGDAFRARLGRIYSRQRPDLIGQPTGTKYTAWYLDEDLSSTLLSVPPTMTQGNLEVGVLRDPIDILHLGWKIANSCLDIVTGTHQEFAASYLLHPLMLTVSIQDKGADPSKPALFRANFAFDPAQGTLFLLNGIRADVSTAHKELLGAYLRALVDQLQKRATEHGIRQKISVFIPKKIYRGSDRTLSASEIATAQGPAAKGGHQEPTLGGGFLETKKTGLKIAKGMMALHADIINVRIATYETQEWVSPELEGWAYTAGNPVVPLGKTEAKAKPSLVTRGTFAAAIESFMRYGFLGRPAEWKIAMLASVRESLLAFAGPLFQAAHDNESLAQARWRVAGQVLLIVAAAAGAVAAFAFFGASPDVARYAAAVAGAWLGSVTFHLAWDLAPLALGQSILTGEQRAVLAAAQAAHRSGDAADRRAVENILSLLPAIRGLGLENGLDLRAQAGQYLRDEIRAGRRPSEVLPELAVLAGTPAANVADYASVARPAAEARDATVNVRVFAEGATEADIRAEARKELARRAETGATDTVVFAVTGDDAAVRALLNLDGQFGSTVRVVRNDASLTFEPQALEARLNLSALKKINVFLSQNAALSAAALESLESLERLNPRLASIYLLIEAATRIAVPVTTAQLGDMIRLRRLVETQA